MAARSVTQLDEPGARKLLTDEQGFHFFPKPQQNLFAVRAGLSADLAVSTAICLLESVAHISSDGVGKSGMDASEAYLVNFAAQAAQALLHSIERIGGYGYMETMS